MDVGNRERNKSAIPQYRFSETPEDQERELAENPLLRDMTANRRALEQDPHRPLYHFTAPSGSMNDPNGLCFWKGRWHLFYQLNPAEDDRPHWGHATSPDLVHWRDLPYAIYPGPERMCFSGSTLVERDRVVAMYHGVQVGNMVAVSDDPLLLNWKKLTGGPVIPIGDGSSTPYVVHDPCVWTKDGTYYALSNGTPARPDLDYLFQSNDLIHWQYLHPFVVDDRFTLAGDDGACPYFWPVGNRHILLFFSHMSGGQYLLGDYKSDADVFAPTAHGKFNFGAAAPSGVHAPSATPDGHGGVLVILNMNPGKRTCGWDQVMTLPRRLTLSDRPPRPGNSLRVEPAGAIESLRGSATHVDEMLLPANRDLVLQSVTGNSMELSLRVDPPQNGVFELSVLRSPDGEEETRFVFYRNRGLRCSETDFGGDRYSIVELDTTRSSISPDVSCRPPELAPVYLGPEDRLELRVFIDRSVVEVFVNDQQCVAARVYPERADSTGVSLRARGQDARLLGLDAWQMKSTFS